MATYIYRGSTPVIRVTPLNGVNVSELGTPKLAISQELVYLEPPVTVDLENNCIEAALSEADTLQLVANSEARMQMVWTDEQTQNVIRFPVHLVQILESVTEGVLSDNIEEDVIVPEEDEEITPEESTEEETVEPDEEVVI